MMKSDGTKHDTVITRTEPDGFYGYCPHQIEPEPEKPRPELPKMRVPDGRNHGGSHAA